MNKRPGASVPEGAAEQSIPSIGLSDLQLLAQIVDPNQRGT